MSDSNLRDEKSNTIEIKETLKTSFYLGICCLIFTIIITVIIFIASINIAGMWSPFLTAYLLVFFLPIVIILTIWLAFYSRRSKKIRSFTMTDEFITIQVPNKPLFKVKLTDFNTFEVSRERTRDVFTRSSTTRYTFTFRGEGFTEDYVIKSQTDFSRKAIIEIREKLQQFSAAKGKQYIYNK